MGSFDNDVLAAAERMRLTHLEAQIVDVLAERTGMDAASALDLWYRSDLSSAVERNDYGLQFLDANYLVDELLKQRKEHDAL